MVISFSSTFEFDLDVDATGDSEMFLSDIQGKKSTHNMSIKLGAEDKVKK